MRSPADLPRRQRRFSRGRLWLVLTVVVLFVLVTSLRSIAGFYTDYLWFKELHFGPVFTTILIAQITLAVLFTAFFFALLLTNLTIADRIAPRFRAIGPEDEFVQRYKEAIGPHAGKVRLGVAIVFALFAGFGTRAQWNNWILFRHGASFPVSDPQFHKNIGFFVFKLPFIKFLINWWFVAIVITAVITIVAHYLNGGIRLQSPAQRVTPQVKAHISVLLGALALVKAFSYYFERFELDLSSAHVVNGATYTSVHADLPAKSLLILIAVVAAGLFIYNIFRKGWFLPGIAVALWGLVWILVGAVYPALIQSITVKPSELNKERPYIARNIAATRAAFGLTDAQTIAFPYVNTLSPSSLDPNGPNAATIANVRLWDPKFIADTYAKEQEIRAYYKFNTIGIDRYLFNGKKTETLAAVRELSPADVPSNSWVNQHLAYTHGYGGVLSPANAATADGKPVFVTQNVPPQTVSGSGAPVLTQPAVYYGVNVPGFAVVNTGQPELDYQRVDTGNNVTTSYQGTGGVPVGSAVSFRRFAFALRFADPNMVISGLINSHSRAIYVRSVADRIRKAAPFLKLDKDPYPVILGGRVVWVQDAYTVTSRYPYSQTADLNRIDPNSGLSTSFNYVRNSVKAVIDSYDGSVTLYTVDNTDPILKTYERAFPKLFTDGAKMPAELQQHLRYPEDLFRVQTNMFGRYHITDTNGFYSAGDAWSIAQDPGSGSPSAIQQTQTTGPGGQIISTQRTRMDPAYLILRLPGTDQKESFLVLQPFVSSSNSDKQQNLTAFMTAQSDVGDYGKLKVFTVPRGSPIDGPALINATITASPGISEEISLLNQQGSSVKLGNVLVIPIDNSILYVQPLYVQSTQNPVPELRKVIVVNGNRAAMQDTLAQALAALVPGSAPLTQEAQKPGGTTPTTPTTTTPGTPSGPTTTTAPPTLATLVAQEQQAFADADAALKAGDLATYAADIKKAEALAKQIAALEGVPPPTATTAPPTTSTTSTTLRG